jgi:hypothetical protein
MSLVWDRESAYNRTPEKIAGLSPEVYTCPTTFTWKPREASTDAELWEQARTTPFNDILATVTRFYRAARPSELPKDGNPIYDAWYITQWISHEADEDSATYTFKEEQLLYPKWYTPRLDRLNKQIHGLLQSLRGNDSYEASHPRPMTVCICGYLMLLREQFTYELYKSLLEQTMSKTWRSTWLNPWLHRERWACEHSRDGRNELKDLFGEEILQTDASELCK